MKKHLLLLAAVALSACSSNPEPAATPAAAPPAAAAAAPAAATPATPAPVAATARLSDDETVRLGREAVAFLFAGDIDGLWPRLDAQVQTQAQSAANFSQLTQQIFGQIGAETSLVEEEVVAPEQQPGLTVYRRRGHYAQIGQDANLLVAFNADGTIAGINISPAQ